MSNEQSLSSELLKQAGLSGATLPEHDREALWQRIRRSHDRARRLKKWALYAIALLATSIVMIVIAKNTGDQDRGVGLVLRYAGSAGAFLGTYGSVLLIATLLFHVTSGRSLEISGRLANMENLLEGMAAQLQQISPRRQNPES
jgi:hypothetical protein